MRSGLETHDSHEASPIATTIGTASRLDVAGDRTENAFMKGLGLTLILVGTIVLSVGIIKFAQIQVDMATGDDLSPAEIAERTSTTLVYAGIGVPLEVLGAILFLIGFADGRKNNGEVG